jgi:hypothetical protein
MTTDIGSLFAIMVLAHFVFDWLPQPESWALVKHEDVFIRVLHSIVYSVPMAVLFGVIIYMDFDRFGYILLLLFIGHVLEDTYWFPVWWLKNVRKTSKSLFEGLNLGLLIVVDQIVHLIVVFACCAIALG